MTRTLFGLLASSLLLLAGCSYGRPLTTVPGFLYSHTVRPLDVNQDRTPAEGTGREDSIKHIHIPLLSGAEVNVLWHSTAIGDIARRNGLETVYYADLETLSVLTIWNKYTVHVYGK